MRSSSCALRTFGRGLALAVTLVAVGTAARLAAGDLPAQAAALRGLADPAADPVGAVLSCLAIVTEALSAYLLLVTMLASASALPGALGRFGAGGLRLLALPILRRGLETALGGVLLAHVALGPSVPAARAATAPWPSTVSRTAASEPAATPASTDAMVSAAVRAAAHGASLGISQGDRRLPERARPGQETGRRPPPGPPPGSSAAPVPVPVPAPGPVPPSMPPPGASPGSPPGPSRARPNVHMVVSGDTLWDLAERRLPPSRRSASTIAGYWPLLHEANRQVIGADPDLLRPGMRLRIPPPPG